MRVEFAGAVYHVMARGNERRDIFRDETHGADNRITTDSCAPENHRPAANPYVIPDAHWFDHSGTSVAIGRIDLVEIGVVNRHIVADLAGITDADALQGTEHDVIAEPIAPPDRNLSAGSSRL